MDKIEVTNGAVDPDHYGPIGDAARGIASYCDDPQRVHVYTAAFDAIKDILATRTDATPVAWMPIESAPKDGTTILLGAPAQTFQGNATEPRSTIGHWTTKEECREVIGDCGGECRCPEYRYHEPYWLSWDGGFTEQNPPTHWQPLPAAPDVTCTHPPATDVAALVEAAKETNAALERDGDPAFAHLILANKAALAPFTKGQNDE